MANISGLVYFLADIVQSQDSKTDNSQCKLPEDIPKATPGFLTVYDDLAVFPERGACALDVDYLRGKREMAWKNYVALVSHPANSPTDQQQGYMNGLNCGRCIKGSYKV